MLREMYPVSGEIEKALIEYDLPEEMLDLIVAFYGLSEKTFSEPCFCRLVGILKEKFDYPLMNTNMACMYASLLCVCYDNPASKIYRLLELVEIFRSTGFRSRVSNMMAFAFLEEQDDAEERATKALKLYHAMHERHGIITGEDDYLATMFLAGADMEVTETIDALKVIHRQLTAGGFSRGNALQTLSHQLLMAKESSKAAEAAVRWHKAFKKDKIKTNASQITYFGLIAVADPEDPDFMTKLNTRLNEARMLDGGRRLRTIDKTVVLLEGLKYGVGERDNLPDSYLRASLLLLLTGYLFRERLI